MLRCHRTIERALYQPDTTLFLWVNNTLAALTMLSVLALILQTVQSLNAYDVWFRAIEYIAVFFFTLEYIGRIAVTNKKRHYLMSFFGIIDLLAILPTFLAAANLTFLKSARVLRILRFLRILRLAKLMRGRNTGITALNFYIYFFALASATIIFASLLYVAEGDTAAAANIPLAIVWVAKVILGGVAQTIPHTIWGDVIIIATRFTGLLLFGLLVYVLGGTIQRALFGTDTFHTEEHKH